MTSQADPIATIETMVRKAEAEGRETLVLSTTLARALLKCSRRRPPLSRSDIIRESCFIGLARIRKRELIASGLGHEAAHQLAAEEIEQKFVRLTSRRLAVSTISRLMQNRPEIRRRKISSR